MSASSQKLHRATPFVALFAGLLFAVGLALSGMTEPAKVTGFLDVTGAWDPSLAFVMGGGVVVLFVANALRKKMSAPWLGGVFPAAKTGITFRLAFGAALFGAGWGIAGFCPGPALVSLAALGVAARWFVPAMIAGLVAATFLDRRSASEDVSASSTVSSAVPNA